VSSLADTKLIRETASATLDPRTRLLLEGRIAPTLLRMAWPNILVMLVQASTGLIETWWVSRLGLSALAGMAPAVFQPGNVRPGQTQETGDIAAGFKQAAYTIEETHEIVAGSAFELLSHTRVVQIAPGDRTDGAALDAGRHMTAVGR